MKIILADMGKLIFTGQGSASSTEPEDGADAACRTAVLALERRTNEPVNTYSVRSALED